MKTALLIATFIVVAIVIISQIRLIIAQKETIDSEIEEDLDFMEGEAFLFDDENDNSQHILMS